MARRFSMRSNNRRGCLWSGGIALFGMAAAAAAGAGLPASAFRVDSTLVLVNVSVLDSAGRPVSGLREQQFRVLENGKPRQIASFSHEDVPVSVALIFDQSGSMSGKLDRAREMASRFCADLAEGDELFLVTVQSKPRLEWDYTTSCADIQSALLHARPHGYTALLDAVPMAVQHLRNARNARRVVLVISDGGENASRMRPAGIRRLLREADAQVYAAALVEPAPPVIRQVENFAGSQADNGPGLLEELTEASGGSYYQIDDSGNLAQAASRIAAVIHHQYVIGYRPQEAVRDGKYRRISVKVQRDPSMPRVFVLSRRGYYAPIQ